MGLTPLFCDRTDPSIIERLVLIVPKVLAAHAKQVVLRTACQAAESLRKQERIFSFHIRAHTSVK